MPNSGAEELLYSRCLGIFHICSFPTARRELGLSLHSLGTSSASRAPGPEVQVAGGEAEAAWVESF